MTNSSIEIFKAEISEIRAYIKHTILVNNVAAFDLEIDNAELKSLIEKLSIHHIKNERERKLFEYKAIVISLYGILERNLEKWIQEFLSLLPTIVANYSLLNEKLRDNHFKLSIQLINNIAENRHVKFQHLDKENILKKLNICIETPDCYLINTEGFIISSGNLKHSKVVEFFSPLDINLNNQLLLNEKLKKHFKDEWGNSYAQLKVETLFKAVDDLVEMRNQIAHGSEVNEILSTPLLESLIDFLEIYCEAIFDVLSQEIIKLESQNTFERIENVLHIWDNKILGFTAENRNLKINDFIIIDTGNNYLHKRPILEITIDRVSYEDIDIKDKINIAVRLSPRIKTTHTFYIKKNVLKLVNTVPQKPKLLKLSGKRILKRIERRRKKT